MSLSTEFSLIELENLVEAALHVTDYQSPIENLRKLLATIVDLFDATGAGVRVYNQLNDSVDIIATHGSDKTIHSMKLGDGIAGHLLEQYKNHPDSSPLLYITNNYNESDWLHPEYEFSRTQRAIVAVLLTWERAPIGFIYMDSLLGRPFDSRDANLFLIFSHYATVAILRAPKLRRTAGILTSTNFTLPKAIEIDTELLQNIVDYAYNSIDCDIVTLFTVDSKSGLLESPPVHRGIRHPQKLHRGFINNVRLYELINENVTRVDDINADPYFSGRSFTISEDVKSYISISLSERDRKLGLMILSCRSNKVFSETQVAKITAFAKPFASALNARQLGQERQKSLNTMKIALSISHDISTQLDLREIWSTITKSYWKLFDYKEGQSSCFVLSINDEHLECITASSLLTLEEVNRLIKLRSHREWVQSVVELSETMIYGNLNIAQNSTAILANSQSQLLIPLISNHINIGIICIEHIRQYAFSQDDILYIDFISQNVIAAYQNAKLFSSAESGHSALLKLNTSITKFMGVINKNSTSISRKNVLQDMVNGTSDAIESRWVTLALFDEGNVIEIFRSHDAPDLGDNSINRNKGISLKVYADRRTRVFTDTLDETSDFNPKLLDVGVKSSICVPVISSDDECWAVLWAHYNDRYRDFEQTEITAFELYAKQLAVLYEVFKTKLHYAKLVDTAETLSKVTTIDSDPNTMQQTVNLLRRSLNCNLIFILHNLNNQDAEVYFSVSNRLSKISNIEVIIDKFIEQTLSEFGADEVLKTDGRLFRFDNVTNNLSLKQVSIDQLRFEDLQVGYIVISHDFIAHNVLTSDELHLHQLVINHLAVILEHRSLVKQIRLSNDQNQVLHEIASTLVQGLQDPIQALGLIAEKTRNSIDADFLIINPIHRDHFVEPWITVAPAHALYDVTDARELGFTAETLELGFTIRHHNNLDKETPNFVINNNIEYYIGIRLGDASDPVGVMFVDYVEFNPEAANHKQFLESVGNIIASALTTAFDLKDLQYLNELNLGMFIGLKSRTLLELCSEATSKIDELIRYDVSAIWLIDDNEAYLSPVHVTGVHKHQITNKRVELGDGLIGQTALQSEIVIENDVTKRSDQMIIEGLSIDQEQSLIISPIVFGEDHFGVLALSRLDGAHFDNRRDGQIIRLICHTMATAIQLHKYFYSLESKLDAYFNAISVDELVGKWFYSIVAHDVRNVLHIISSLIVGFEYTNMGKKRKRFLDITVKRIEQSASAIDEFIELTKISVDEYRYQNINELVNKVLNMMELRCSDAGISILRDLSSDIPYLDMNAVQIVEVIVNIVSNSIKAMFDTSTKQLSVITRNSADEEYVELIIRDTGTGIPNKYKDSVFWEVRSYWPTDESLKGSGLGLLVSKRIIEERHDGELSFSTKYGSNSYTEFIIRLPVD